MFKNGLFTDFEHIFENLKRALIVCSQKLDLVPNPKIDNFKHLKRALKVCQIDQKMRFRLPAMFFFYQFLFNFFENNDLEKVVISKWHFYPF